jgi:hypothetical protein
MSRKLDIEINEKACDVLQQQSNVSSEYRSPHLH